jgi:DNA-binding beta-propeller fold protein YncE
MPADAEVTVGLFAADGKLLRWVVQGQFAYAGENHQSWDGLDQWGQPVPAGTYRLKAAYHAPLVTDYKLSLCNPGSPPWPTADDKGDWLSDEADPQAVATDGKWVFLGAPGCELGFSVMALDEKGRRQWGMRLPLNPHTISLAVAGDHLFVLYSGPELTDGSTIFNGHNAIDRALLLCLDKHTGRPAGFTRDDPRLLIASSPFRDTVSWLWDLRNRKSYSAASFGGQPRYGRTDVGEPTNALGLAAAGGKLYVSLFFDNELLVLDPATGRPAGDPIPVDAPVGLARLDEQTLAVVSGTRVLKVDLPTGRGTPLIADGLLAPHDVALDPKGRIFVSDWGASFQVKVFDGDGKFRRAIGKPGGRPWAGAWDAAGMLVPRGIAVTDDQELWVAEDDGSPKRVSVWDAETGAFVRDYIGPAPYAGGTYFWVDPKDPTRVNAEGARFKVDYEQKTWAPEAIAYRRANRDDPFTPNGHNLGPTSQVRILYHDGREYAVFCLDKGITSIMRRDGDIYRAVAGFGKVHVDPSKLLNGNGTGTFIRDDFGMHLYEGFFPECFAGHMGDNYSWTDSNGDHLVQPEEMRWVSTARSPSIAKAAGGATRETQGSLDSYWGNAVSPDWSYFFAGRTPDHMVIYRVDVKGWTPGGAPIYDMADARPIFQEDRSHGIFSLYATADRKLIVIYDYEYGKSPDSIACLDLEGRRLWSMAMPRRFDGIAPHANNGMYDFDVPGLGDVVCTSAYHGSYRPFLFTSDGLYVGTLFDNTRLGPAALWGESHVYFYQAPDASKYVVNGGDQAEHMFRLAGLDSGAGRFESDFFLSGQDVRNAAAARQAPRPAPPPQPLLGVTWVSKPPKIDGDLSDWDLDDGTHLDGGKDRGADIALARDADTLYLAFKVHEPRPLVNGGGDWQTLFATGDCVDLMLQTDPTADPHRRSPAAGDLRLLMGAFQDKPVAVIYRPIMPGAPPGKLTTVRMDRVEKLASARVAVVRDAANHFYTVEAAVPLADLGIDPRSTGDLRGDVGAVFADESGNSRSLRLYHFNRRTQMINDVPTEATLQPGEWGAIAMPLGPNLLGNGGFKRPLAPVSPTLAGGWSVTTAKNGAEALLSDESPYTGRRCLLLRNTAPVQVDPRSYDDPDYAAFVKGLNHGAGPSHVEVRQRVNVVPGHLYSVRYHYRCEDFQPERKQVGHPRGYVVFGCRLDWNFARAGRAPVDAVGADYETMPQWQTVWDYRGSAVAAPFRAPESAVSATVVFRLTTAAEARLPRAFLDQVEMVDVTPGR